MADIDMEREIYWNLQNIFIKRGGGVWQEWQIYLTFESALISLTGKINGKDYPPPFKEERAKS